MSITFKEIATTKTGLVARFIRQDKIVDLDQQTLATAIADQTAENPDEFSKALTELRQKKQF